MTSWSKTNYACRFCKTNANRQYERTAKNKTLKEWWKSLSAEEKVVGESGFVMDVRCVIVAQPRWCGTFQLGVGLVWG
eukprot:13159647-Alexandrium_andersonii.AAC.2